MLLAHVLLFFLALSCQGKLCHCELDCPVELLSLSLSLISKSRSQLFKPFLHLVVAWDWSPLLQLRHSLIKDCQKVFLCRVASLPNQSLYLLQSDSLWFFLPHICQLLHRLLLMLLEGCEMCGQRCLQRPHLFLNSVLQNPGKLALQRIVQ